METVEPSVLPFVLKELGASNLIISAYITTIASIFNLTICPIASFMSDRHRSKWGRRIPFLARATLAAIEGEEYLVGLSIDISELVSAREKIKDQVIEISKLNELLKTENIYLKDQLEITGLWHDANHDFQLI
jgi:hypothetical protein